MVDLVFVLATKLDLNVNDMRSLLNNNAKQNMEQFEAINNKQDEDIETLNKKIDNLRKENRQQRERFTNLADQHENTLAMYNKLKGNFICFPNFYEKFFRTI